MFCCYFTNCECSFMVMSTNACVKGKRKQPSSPGLCVLPELYTIAGNANGKICMFPFHYKDRWFDDCTSYDSPTNRPWCSVLTRSENERWGYCPSTSKHCLRKYDPLPRFITITIHLHLLGSSSPTMLQQNFWGCGRGGDSTAGNQEGVDLCLAFLGYSSEYRN